MKISKEARNKARQLFGASCVDGVVQHDRARTVVTRLKDKKPRGYLPILSQFIELVRLNLDEHSATVESVTPLDDVTKGRLEGALRSQHGQHITIDYATNPELIGGMRVKVGSAVLDSSVRARLDRLKTSFAH